MFPSIYIPLLFVFLWSTGFIGAKYGLPNAEPFTFLAIRLSIVSIILIFIAFIAKIKWPKKPKDYYHISIAGILIHAAYLGGVFSAIYLGMAASVSAIIVGLQPIVVAIIAWVWLKKSLTPMQISGLLLGFIGVVLVVSNQGIDWQSTEFLALVWCIFSLLSISFGSIYQKHYANDFDLLPAVTIQFIVSSLILIILAFIFENRQVSWNLSFVLALGWLVVVLSLGTSFLLLWIIRKGEPEKVASMFYLVPPLVVIEARVLFNEGFNLIAILGIVACITGVALVMSSPPKNHKTN